MCGTPLNQSRRSIQQAALAAITRPRTLSSLVFSTRTHTSSAKAALLQLLRHHHALLLLLLLGLGLRQLDGGRRRRRRGGVLEHERRPRRHRALAVLAVVAKDLHEALLAPRRAPLFCVFFGGGSLRGWLVDWWVVGFLCVF